MLVFFYCLSKGLHIRHDFELDQHYPIPMSLKMVHFQG